MKLNDANAVKILNMYNNRVNYILKPLSENDKKDIRMELDSHIYESMARYPQQDEVSTVMFALEKLGDPELFLPDVVAERKLKQAGKTFNPLHIASALALNIGRGFIKSVLFIIIALLYVTSFAFAALAILKPIFPSSIGLFVDADKKLLAAGWVVDNGAKTELLGLWFTPIFIAGAICIYVLITILLKYIPRRRKIKP